MSSFFKPDATACHGKFRFVFQSGEMYRYCISEYVLVNVEPLVLYYARLHFFI